MGMRLDPDRTALLVIDMQNDFYASGGNAQRRGKQLQHMQGLPSKINNFASSMRSLGVKVIFTKFVYDPKISPANYSKIIKETKENNWLCVAASEGAELASVVVGDEDMVLEKLSYDCFANTSLLSTLKEQNVENLVITGVRTEVCVLATAERSFAEGFRTFVASDLVGTYDDKQVIADAVLDALKYASYVMTAEHIRELMK